MEFTELAAKLGAALDTADVGATRIPDSFTLAQPGLPPIVVTANYSSGEFSGATFTVHVAELAGSPTIDLRPETDSDRQGKAIGLSREVQVGDQAFDDAVYIDTEAGDELVRRLFEPPEVRRRVLQFIEQMYLLSIEGGVRWRLGRDSLVEATPERLRALAEIAAQFPSLDDVALDRVGPREPLLGPPVFWTIGVLLYGAYIILDPPAPIFDRHSFLSFVYGLPLWLTFATVVILDRRGRPSSYAEILAILFMSFLLFILPASALVWWVNATWDTSAPRVEVVRARYLDYDSKRDDHEIEVYGLSGAPELELEFDDDELAADEGLRALRLTVRDGYFGWPYMTAVAVEP